MSWREDLLTVVPILMLFAYALIALRVGGHGTARELTRKLFVLGMIGTAVWALISAVDFTIAMSDLSDESAGYDRIQALFDRSILYPIANPINVFGFVPSELHSYARLLYLSLPLGLFTLDFAVVAMAKWLPAAVRASMQRHKIVYLATYTGVAVALVLFLAPPQPDRNPDMPSIPLPPHIDVKDYTRTTEEHHWSVTSLVLTGTTYDELFQFYSGALGKDKWELVQGRHAAPDPIGAEQWLFSRGDKTLEIHVLSVYEMKVTLVLRDT